MDSKALQKLTETEQLAILLIQTLENPFGMSAMLEKDLNKYLENLVSILVAPEVGGNQFSFNFSSIF